MAPRDPWVDLPTAARSVGRSIRTIQTWAAQGHVRTRPHPADRRRTLIALRDVVRHADTLTPLDPLDRLHLS